MGMYVYRVTAQRVICSDGQPANVAKYAYKPYFSWDGQKYNNQMAFKSGCHASDRMAANGKLSGRVVIGDRVFANPNNYGTFYDDCTIGTDKMPAVEGVTAPTVN